MTYQLSSESLGLKTGLYQLLDKPVEPRSIELEQSAVRLVPSESKVEPQPTLLVLSRDLATQWGIKDSSQISVYEKETLATVNFGSLDPNKRNVLPTLAILSTQEPPPVNLSKAEWRSPEEFFTERILLVENPAQEEHTPFPGASEVIGQQNLSNWTVPILPIKPELLKYLDISYLADNITITSTNNKGIFVELKLPLHGVDGQGKDFRAIREYKDDEIERRSNTSLPVLEIWPNFKAENWKFYYTYYDSTGISKEEDTFYAQPYLEKGDLLAQKPNSKSRQIWHSETLPTAMVCETYSRKLKKNVTIGCLLLNDKDLPPVSPQQGRSWDIGVDFGTSSTNVYAKKSHEDEPSAVSFQEHLWRITQSSDDNRGEMVKYFFPPFEPSTPFLTLFRPEENITDEKRNQKPLLRGNIRYVKPGFPWNPDTGEIGVKSRFKWQFEIKCVEGFLAQLAVQCLAEAVAQGATQVNWHFSYPTVLEKNARNISDNAWKKIVEITKSVKIATNDPKSKTESHASAIFFSEQHQVPPEGVICIDIGGETSDISILGGGGFPRRGSFPRQCSVRFAGEHFFTDLLKKNPSVLEDLGFKDIERLRTAASTTSFYSQIDSLVRMKREELWERLQQAPDLQQSDPDGKVYGLLHLIALGLSGLMFYAGLQLNDTKAKGLIDDDLRPLTFLTLCLGGNGAWTLQWLGLGNFSPESPHNNLFKQVLKIASGLEQDTGFEIILSSNPKAEVAYGLIKPDKYELETSDQAKVELSGENFRDAQGNPLSWNTELDKELLSSGLNAPEQLSQLRQFIEVFNQYANTDNSYVRPVDIDRYERNIVRDMQGRLNTFRNLGQQKINAVEPLFLIALRRLLEEERDRWARGWS